MAKIDEKKVKEWEELVSSVVNIYIKLMECERKNDFGKEYKNALYILPTALRIEKEKFLSMRVNETNFRQLGIRFNISDDEIEKAAEGNIESFIKMRKCNYFTSMVNFTYNGFYKPKRTINIQEYVDGKNELSSLQDEIFVELYQSQLTVNIVNMLECYINSIEDEEVRNYLIYIKYFMIGTIPKYEEDFALFGGKVLPTREILPTFPTIDGYSEADIKTLTETSLKRDILDEIKTMSKVSDMIVPYCKKDIYKVLAINKARLISLNSKEFIESIRKEIDKFLNKERGFYTEINKIILDMFDEALSYVKEQEQKKKALK